MKWMYFLVICATVVHYIYARPGPNEFTHSNSINVTDTESTSESDIPAAFTQEDESILRRYLQQLNYSFPKNIEEYDGSNNNILNNFLKTSIEDLKKNRFTSIHSTVDPDSEPLKSYNIGIPDRYYEYEINEPQPAYINVPVSRPQTAIFTNIKPIFELENVDQYSNGYFGGSVRPTFVTAPTESTLISPVYHSSPTKVTKYHLITPRPVYSIRPTHRPYVNIYTPYDPSDPDSNYDENYNQIDSLNFDNGYNNQPFNVKNSNKKKKKCKQSVTNAYDPECESVKLTLSENFETTTVEHVIKIPTKGTSTHDNKLDFDEKQKDPANCSGGCCNGSCTEPYPQGPIPYPVAPIPYPPGSIPYPPPPLNPLPGPPLPFPANVFPTPNALPIPQQIAPVSQVPSQIKPLLSGLPSLVFQNLSPGSIFKKPKRKKPDDDFDFDLDFFDFGFDNMKFGGMKFGLKKILKNLWPIFPYLFALNPLSLGFWTVLFSPVLLVIAGGTALALFFYPWVTKMLIQAKQRSTVVVHKHPGKRPPTPGPWRKSPYQDSGVRWSVRPTQSQFRRKKRFITYENENDYGTQDTKSGTLTETIAQTELKPKSDVIPLEIQPQSDDSKKISPETILVDEKRHLGVAVPISMDEIENEMASHSTSRDTSTSKDGISTWILLSGTNPTTPPDMSSNENQKVDKIAKVRDNSKAPNKTTLKPQINKNKTKPKTTTPTSLENNETNNLEVLADPVPIAQTPILRPKKKSTTTTAQPLDEESVTESMEEIVLLTTTKETPVPFLILEPKDADFDLPQDRSPGKPTTKKPKRNNNKNKKKNKPNKTTESTDEKNSTKIAIKKKENPLGTKIYNYLSREVMPTVGVGLLGLVVTAGLAGYFLSPLGALRRSYDVADRKDDLYYYNNEEYAGTDGQSEEEVFGKVIAGMPLNSNYRNTNQYHGQRPNYFHQNQNPSKYSPQYSNRYRNAPNQQFAQQRPAQQLSYSSYHPNNANHAANYQRIHHIAPASQNVVSQKSISNSIFAIKPSPITTTTSSTVTTMLPSTVIHEINQIPNKDSDDELKSTDFMEDNPNELKKRTQFVVGSVLPDTNVMDISDPTIPVPEHGPRRRRRSLSMSSRKSSVNDVKNLEDLYENLKKRIETVEKNEPILKEMKHLDYEMSRLRKVIAEIKDIEQFQDELHIKGRNDILRDTISNGVIHINGDIKFVNELLDNPTEIESKIANREEMLRTVNGEKPLNVPAQKKSDQMSTETFETTETPSGIMSFLKILELKAAFGVNVLRSIRPAFDRAFAQVFDSTESHTSALP